MNNSFMNNEIDLSDERNDLNGPQTTTLPEEPLFSIRQTGTR